MPTRFAFFLPYSPRFDCILGFTPAFQYVPFEHLDCLSRVSPPNASEASGCSHRAPGTPDARALLRCSLLQLRRAVQPQPDHAEYAAAFKEIQQLRCRAPLPPPRPMGRYCPRPVIARSSSVPRSTMVGINRARYPAVRLQACSRGFHRAFRACRRKDPSSSASPREKPVCSDTGRAAPPSCRPYVPARSCASTSVLHALRPQLNRTSRRMSFSSARTSSSDTHLAG